MPVTFSMLRDLPIEKSGKARPRLGAAKTRIEAPLRALHVVSAARMPRRWERFDETKGEPRETASESDQAKLPRL
jgi:hypothetical protein